VGVAVRYAPGRHRVALMSMADRPLRAARVEAALEEGATFADAAALATEGTFAPSDGRGSSTYRRRLAVVLTRRALVEASRRYAAAANKPPR
jgi:carbon-monoxide dehydrogenase medium subunit